MIHLSTDIPRSIEIVLKAVGPFTKFGDHWLEPLIISHKYSAIPFLDIRKRFLLNPRPERPGMPR